MIQIVTMFQKQLWYIASISDVSVNSRSQKIHA